MIQLCKLKNDWKDAKYLTYSMWDKIRRLTIIMGDIADWLKIPSETLEHCLKGADIFFQGVAGFADNHFGTGAQEMCNIPCAPKMGDPRNLIS